MNVGLLLPHFGPGSTYERLWDLGSRLADLGFHSAWVRDQLGFRGLGFESRSAHFVDPFIALAGVAARSDIVVGTATLTPIRPPVVTAQLVGSLAYLARGRLVLGVGLGGQPRAFELAGLRYADRAAHFRELVEVIRATARPNASYRGPFTRFDDLTLDPAPPADLPIWYCGTSPGAIRRALRYADGWFPGRCPFVVFDGLLETLRAEAAALGRPMSVGIVPLLSPGRTRGEALERVNLPALLAEAREKPGWEVPFETADDLRGALIAGSADDILVELGEFRRRGVDEVVLDLRQRMDVFEPTLELLAREVLPVLGPESR
ncbi:MAG TPA: LLM class flavin-dependent oxidoreductase [Candidatus Limnocylindrales bacterium]|nr:LLM class flavin-dependent oxidoreductase [Candidatus Limnocylindrales bacterium]